MIILSAVIKTPLPAHTLSYFSTCFDFANMDILDGKELYQKWFTFKETPALNDNFEMYDMENQNFLINTGSYFIIFAGMIACDILKFLLNKAAVKCARYRNARRIGMQMYEPRAFKASIDE